MNDSADHVIPLFVGIPNQLLAKRWPRGNNLDENLEMLCSKIVAECREEGDEAVIRYTRKFDDVDVAGRMRVQTEDIEKAYNAVKSAEITALRNARARILHQSRELLRRLSFEVESDDVKVYHRVAPLNSAGCYVPGGSAAYPSSLLMSVVPAKASGVPRVVVCSPPGHDGEVHPLTLVAADICGVDEFYRIGGIQSIAAMAYGTDTIEPVDIIVGPGNKYVTEAKRFVSRDVAIDMPAGPSELMVVADDTADPGFVAIDLISQAEHDPNSCAILLTTSHELAHEVRRELHAMLERIDRADIIRESLMTNGGICILPDLDCCTDFANCYAPEHVQVVTADSLAAAQRITSAGLVLIGRYTPVAASDYFLGVNHILPTGGFSRVFSGLSSKNFVRMYSIVECTKEGLKQVAEEAAVLADIEGLPNHGLAIQKRGLSS